MPEVNEQVQSPIEQSISRFAEIISVDRYHRPQVTFKITEAGVDYYFTAQYKDWRSTDKATVRTILQVENYDRNCDSFGGYTYGSNGGTSITVTLSREAAPLKRDIIRRLGPSYIDRLERYQRQITARDTREANGNELYDAIAVNLGSAERRNERSGSAEWHLRAQPVRDRLGAVELSINQRDKNRVDISLQLLRRETYGNTEPLSSEQIAQIVAGVNEVITNVTGHPVMDRNMPPPVTPEDMAERGEGF